MTNELSYFSSYNACTLSGKVFIANGSSIPFSGKGSVSITPSIALDCALHVPNLSCNLMSISKLTRSFNCCAKFYPTHCAFQDLITGKTIGNAEERNRLYYINPKVKEDDQNDEIKRNKEDVGKAPLVYSRRQKENVIKSIPLPRIQSPSLDKGNISNSSSSNSLDSKIKTNLDIPIAIRKGVRTSTRYPLAHFISYHRLGHTFQAFTTSLSSEIIPNKIQTALTDPKWSEAVFEVLRALDRNDTWEVVNLPSRKKTVGYKWVFTIKYKANGTIERYKARLVTKGYTQTLGIDYQETFAPVAKINSIRILLSLAANLNWNLFQFDVKNAFLHGNLEEEVYMDLPPDFEDRLNGKRVYDIIVTGDDVEEIQSLKKRLAKEFKIKDLGTLRYFLGIEVARSKERIYVCQRKYILDLLKETRMTGCKLASTPIDLNHRLGAETEGKLVEKGRYQRLVGRLIYLSHTQPDIAYAISAVSQFMHSPLECHLEAVKRILSYLKAIAGKGLFFKKNDHLLVEAYTDADWACSISDRRLTTGYCTFIKGNLVTWRSKKQPVVSRSSAEAEFHALALGIYEVLWIRNLLKELRLKPKGPATIYCDNKAAIDIAHNLVQHDRTKHVEVDKHFIKEKIESGQIMTFFTPTNRQLADVFTKGVPNTKFIPLIDKLGMHNIYAST
ncbi:Retrovirus-related Pol polyprotein from transposon TNT 1-94 [Melia azedarach]|uniref:Retrovirus-related Pol polyprotein from transposon TNT 1-94 n=1 Tax=Melia azedarach TaxID=155640 RepID=A0ACC1YID0_MELAZ|nr:Retrovirus-related Pol polyprotein from transposon TNT 1-94 [Melia azedarach]